VAGDPAQAVNIAPIAFRHLSPDRDPIGGGEDRRCMSLGSAIPVDGKPRIEIRRHSL
jgi:hypothetical protein